MTPENFYNYMQGLAQSHVLIGDTEEQPHFFRGELEEFYRDLRNRVHFPALIVESYELQFEDYFKIREFSFIVAQNYEQSKAWDLVYEAFSLCERIGDEILRKIGSDADNGTLCGNLVPLSAVPLLNEQHLYAGIRYTVQISEEFEEEPNPEMWR